MSYYNIWKKNSFSTDKQTKYYGNTIRPMKQSKLISMIVWHGTWKIEEEREGWH
jgi:hypothetical protein